MGALDISELNATENPHTLATYADLSAALAAIPSNDYKKGGMSIKFVQSSDNKYVQFRYMSSSTAVVDFTNVANWQGVDDEIVAGGINLAESGAVHKSLYTYEQRQFSAECITHGFLNTDGTIAQNVGSNNRGVTDYLEVISSIFIEKCFSTGTPKTYICFYDKDKNFISNEDNVSSNTEVTNVTLPVPSNAVYARIVAKDFNDVIEYTTYVSVEKYGTIQQVNENRFILDNIAEEKTLVASCSIYKDGYIIGNGVGNTEGEEIQASSRSIAHSTGWRKGDTIIVDSISAAGNSTCAVATYKNNNFLENLQSGTGSVLTNLSFTPDYEFDEVRFTLADHNISSITLKKKQYQVSLPQSLEEELEDIEDNIDVIESDIYETNDRIDDLYQYNLKTFTIPCISHGFLTKTGELQPNITTADRGVTDYIKVHQSIHIDRAYSVYSPKTYICFYDQHKNFISNEDNVTQGEYVTDVTLTVPTNAVYARIVQSEFTDTTTYSTYVLEPIFAEKSELVQYQKKSFKFLLIGSSFGVNTCIQFPFLSSHAGIETTCGNLHKNGGSLEDIIDIINGDSTFDKGSVFTPELGKWKDASVDLDAMLEYTDWDVISIQRSALTRNTWNDTMMGQLQTIIEYLQQKTSSYNPKIVLNSIFAYPVFSTDKTTQLTDTNGIITTCQTIENQFGIEIIPTATAVQNARMTKLIGVGSAPQTIPDMAEDSMHLDVGIGSYVCGCLLFEYFLGKMFDMSILTQPYIPTLADVLSMDIFPSSTYTAPTAETSKIAKYAAMMAVRNPTQVNTYIGSRFPYVAE
jgi:hypothetical protein